jgi:hypothetical protein
MAYTSVKCTVMPLMSSGHRLIGVGVVSSEME